MRLFLVDFFLDSLTALVWFRDLSLSLSLSLSLFSRFVVYVVSSRGQKLLLLNFFLISPALKIDLSFEVLIKYPHRHHRCLLECLLLARKTVRALFLSLLHHLQERKSVVWVRWRVLSSAVVFQTHVEKIISFFSFFPPKRREKEGTIPLTNHVRIL